MYKRKYDSVRHFFPIYKVATIFELYTYELLKNCYKKNLSFFDEFKYLRDGRLRQNSAKIYHHYGIDDSTTRLYNSHGIHDITTRRQITLLNYLHTLNELKFVSAGTSERVLSEVCHDILDRIILGNDSLTEIIFKP